MNPSIEGYINSKLFPITSLGPPIMNKKSTKFIGIWFQGCEMHCNGCISQHTWEISSKYKIKLGKLLLSIKPFLKEADGLVISGGEPFLQNTFLYNFIKMLRYRFDKPIIIYTGFLLEDLKKDKTNERILELADILIDGKFESKNPTSSIWKGSNNQKMHILSKRISEEDIALWNKNQNRRLNAVKTEEGINIIGIPKLKEAK